MPKEIAKAYDAKEHEDNIYKMWEESGVFNPDNLNLPADAPTYTIVLPPPNITAKLHLGHAAMLAIEDLMIRYKRMKGFRALWIPGTDHAAIATQNVVEKKLLREGISRHDLGREKFILEVDKFLKETQTIILNQTRKMGSSLDWSREAFTLDEQRQRAVKKMFIDMYNEGVIERGERVINWCPRCKSTLADDEVEHKDQKTILYTFKYSKDFPFSISTTRPETKLGDSAVAVNPKDARYKDLVGKVFNVNFVGIDLKLKVITDYEIDQGFGTGALGVTPAHSMIDAKMAEVNNLKIIKVIDEDANIREGFQEYSGKTALEARKMIVEKLRAAELLEKEEEIDNSLSICYRCDTAIEPLPSKQWFVNVNKELARLGGKSIKQKAIEAAKIKDIKFIPERFEKIYIDWMENLHNWCISRQIWFGHRIPVWYKGYETYVGDEAPSEDGWTQDEDSLDTWFSSGMWTFSTLGWPDNYKDGIKSGDLARFTPTQVLETGFEIITLWVSRMIMMTFFALDEVPFTHVYLHGMILDDKGQKMSKSKGNGIDPLDVIEKFGTDSVRLSLLSGNTPGNNMRLSEEKIGSNKNFVNKLWNISRFILTKSELGLANFEYKEINRADLKTSDAWILEKMRLLISGVTEDIEEYRYSIAGEKLKEFTWNDLADWYLEASKFDKSSQKEKVLFLVLSDLLKLWHPFIPFVTEVIWKELGASAKLIISEWPDVGAYEWLSTSQSDIEAFDIIKKIIESIRNARALNKVEPSRKVTALVYANQHKGLITKNQELILGLRTGIEKIEISEDGEKIEGAIYVVNEGIEIYLIGTIDHEKENLRINKEIENLEKVIAGLSGKLNNAEFVNNAPEKIVKMEKDKLDKYKQELNNLKK